MICPNCKKDIADDSIFCSGCGLKIGGQLPETKNKKINAKGIAVVIVIVLIAAGGGGIAYMNTTPEAKYNKAEKAYRNRDYKKSVEYYTAAGDYRDAEEKLEQAQTTCHYEDGVNLMEQGDYENAALALKAANGFEDANEKLESREYSDAKTAFKKISGYLDTDEMANACVLMLAREDMLAGKLNIAKKALESLPADCSYKGYKVSALLEILI